MTGLFENGLIWFGAGVSLAEILTGMCYAGMGTGEAFAAIGLGHAIGCLLLFLSGVIGGRERKSAMASVRESFGRWGGTLFALANVLQLSGWTAIMIYDGAVAAGGVADIGHPLWCAVIGGLIILWIVIGIKNLGKVNTISMAALFLLTIVLCAVLFSKEKSAANVTEGMSFGAALELSIAMPLSWLPLVSDYTREAKEPVRASAVSAVVYGVVSCWMYLIGMFAARLTGESDIARVLLTAGLGAVGLLIIVFSTVTTTFLDAWSAGISAESVSGKINGKAVAIGVGVIGTLCAAIFPMDDITGFLYLIGSVFSPMIAIQIADAFLNRKKPGRTGQIVNMAIWLAGFILYRVLMTLDIPVGNTLPDMAAVVLISVIAYHVLDRRAWSTKGADN